MKRNIIFAVFAVLAIAIIIPFVFSAITSFNLISPSNDAWVSDITPTFNFSAVSDIDATFPCTLLINEINYGNVMAVNNTPVNITANPALADGSYIWCIECLSNGSYRSLNRTISIDTTKPLIILRSPVDDLETTNHRFDFEFKATDNLASDLSCELYVDGQNEDSETAMNNTDETFDNIVIKSGSHTWYVVCEDKAGNSNKSETRSLEIKSFCENGECGDIEIDKVYEPDTGDNFYPGDKITVKIKVENKADDDLDVVVEAELYDIDEDDVIADAEVSVWIDEDDHKTVTLSIDIPSDIDEGHDFAVRFKAYEDGAEDEHCDEDSISIDMKRESHSVIIKDVELDQLTVPCGGIAHLIFEVANIGKNNEDVKIEVSSDFFNWTKSRFSLDEGDDNEFSVPITIPLNGSDGDYTVKIKVFYRYYDSVYNAFTSASKIITVQGNCPPEPAPDVSFSTSQTSSAFTGSSFTIKVAVTNTGNVKSNYTISASGYEGWANLNNIEPATLNLNAGKTGYTYISLTPDANATGSNIFMVDVTFDSTTKEQTVSVEVKKQTAAAAFIDRFNFSLSRNWQWFALIILLVIIILILAIFLVKQGTKHRRYFGPEEIQNIKLETFESGKKKEIIKRKK